MQQQIDDSLRQEKLLATLSSFFGGVALLLAMIGLYGVLSYRFAQRHKEIGIRLALGARQSSVLWLILKDVSVVLLAGVAAGLGVSWWATRFLRTMLFDLNPHDARIIVLAVGALLAVGFLAGLFPARRATRVDPIVALRYE
jgi:ABC-type antimicrobial peptide transport system permease subunit